MEYYTGQSELLIDLSGEQDLNVKGSIKDENGKVGNARYFDLKT